MSEPIFYSNAQKIAYEMSGLTLAEIAHSLGVNPAIALQVQEYYHNFTTAPLTPAIWSYNGIVYKHLSPETLPDKEFQRMDKKVRICSFLYGLLRPLDAIGLYRLEGNVSSLPITEGRSLFEYWRPLLTDLLIQEVQSEGGKLLFLASEEMKRLFDWKRLKASVKVIQPLFKVQKGSKTRQIVVYTKMMRGSMCRYALQNNMQGEEEEMRAYAQILSATLEAKPEQGLYTYIL